MIQAKKKICKGCGKENYIWARGMCKLCASKAKGKTSFKKSPRKATGERDLFLAIWAVRPHICVNCLSPLGDEPLAHFFSHINGKGAHPEDRLKPGNIELNCFDCHYALQNMGRSAYNLRKKVKIIFPLH